MNFRDDRDIIDLLMDFDNEGLNAGDRVNLRERAAVAVFKLRREIEQLKKSVSESVPVTYGGHTEFYLVPEKSAPERSATQNTAEGLPPAMAQCAGADTRFEAAIGGLELLLAAVHAGDPKREVLVRIGDIMRELKSGQTGMK